MNKILIATGNPGKLEEIKKGLSSLKRSKIILLALNDVRVENKPEETGDTFKKNALIKAKFYAKETNLPTIGDDGGLIIPSLNNGPGVKSRRWPGYEATDEQLIKFSLSNLRGFNRPKRTAYLTVCLCFFYPKTNKIIYEEKNIKGWIAYKPSKTRVAGYPFRSLFIVDKYNKYYDDLTDKEHEEINHRLIATKRLAKRIKDLV